MSGIRKGYFFVLKLTCSLLCDSFNPIAYTKRGEFFMEKKDMGVAGCGCGRKRIIFSHDLEKIMYENFVNGESLAQISGKLKVSDKTIQKILKEKFGLKNDKISKNKIEERRREIFQDFESGMRIDKIIKKYKLREKHFFVLLRKNNLSNKININISSNKKGKIVEEYKEGMSLEEIGHRNKMKYREILMVLTQKMVLIERKRKSRETIEKEKAEVVLCNTCNKKKERVEFLENRLKRHSYECRECSRNRAWRRGLKNYNITEEEYNAMLKEQNGVCAICGKEDVRGKRLSIDHDHKTGKVRGLLCGNCNLGLGALGDEVIIIEKSLKYLYSFKTKKKNEYYI